METTAFRIEGDWTPGPLALQILEEFPHSIHFDYSLHPDQWYKVPEKVYYCAECEAQARMMRWREQGRGDAEPVRVSEPPTRSAFDNYGEFD
jgi:hypothetical protein